MKTLKPGRKQNGWAKRFQCTGKGNSGGGCGAELLVEQSDLFRTSQSFYDGSTDYFITFKCHDCGCLTNINYDGPDLHSLPKRSEWEAGQKQIS